VLIGAGTPREAAARGLAYLFFIHAEDAGAIILVVASPDGTASYFATTLYVEVGRFKRTLSLARPSARRSVVASASRYAVNTDKPQVETLEPN
jgi:hypothetical protein